MSRTANMRTMKPSTVVLAISVGILASIVAISAVSANIGSPTKGKIPDNAWRDDNALDEALVPDYIGYLDNSGEQVGWVSSVDLGLRGGGQPKAVVTVYGNDLKTVVGTDVAGRGFVPLGEDPEAVPTMEIWTSPK